jgi:hypothetical protein
MSCEIRSSHRRAFTGVTLLLVIAGIVVAVLAGQFAREALLRGVRDDLRVAGFIVLRTLAALLFLLAMLRVSYRARRHIASIWGSHDLHADSVSGRVGTGLRYDRRNVA